MNVKNVRDALLSVTDNVYHYKANPECKDRYIVWGETRADATFNADDNTDIMAIAGEIYYYTTVEYDEIFDDICTALSDNNIAWSLSSIGYDDELGQIVYALIWEVACGNGKIYRQ